MPDAESDAEQPERPGRHAARGRNWAALLFVAAVIALLAVVVCGGGGAIARQLGYTLLLAVGSLTLALVVAAPLAVLLMKTALPGRRWAWLVVGGLALTPLFVHLAGWEAVLGKLGWLTNWGAAAAPPWLVGLRGAMWVHGVAAVPWLVLWLAVGLERTPADEEEAALLEQPPLSVLLRLLAPRALGAAVLGLLWLTVQIAGEMTVTNIYLTPTFAEAFYNSFVLSADANAAARELWPALGVIALLVVLAAQVVRFAGGCDLSALARPRIRWPLGAWRWPLAGAAWCLLFLLAAVPLASLLYEAGVELHAAAAGQVTSSWSPLKLCRTLALTAWRMRGDFGWSLSLAALTASLTLLLALPLAWLCQRGRWGPALLLLLGAVLTALPGPCVAAGVVWLLNRAEAPVLVYLYDRTLAAPVLALLVRTLPLTTLLLWHALGSVNRQVVELAQLEGAGSWRVLLLVVLPQRRGAVAAAWLLAAALTLGDVNFSTQLMPPGSDTIARRLFGMLHSGVDDQAAAACLLLLLGYVCLVSFGWRFLVAQKNPADP